MSRTVTWVSAAVALLASLGLGAATPASASASSVSSVTLLSQSVVASMNAAGSAHFTITLAGPRSDTVAFALYPALTTRSGLLAAEAGHGLGAPLGHSDSIALHCGSPSSSANSFSFSLLASGTSRPLGCQPTMAKIALACSNAAQTCGGVYPLAVTTPTRRFVTFVTVIGSHVAQALRVATLVSVAPGPGAPHTLSSLSTALSAEQGVPVDLSASPRALQTLAAETSSAASLRSLTHWATASSQHELLDTPLVPVDPAVLRASGLDAVSAQVIKRGTDISDASGLTTVTRSGGWVAPGSPSPQTLTGISQLGFSRVLVSDTALSQPTASGLYWGQPFKVYGAPATTTALAVDPTITAETLATSDPQLRAYQLLADLAFHHFERPSLTTPQGIVVMTPPSWTPSVPFLETYLSGLSHNPLLRPSTLSHLFITVPVGANGAAGIRQLSNGTATPWPLWEASRFRSEQLRQAHFATATPSALGTTNALPDLLLDAADLHLNVAGRSTVIAHAAAALNAQRDQLSISTAQITTTALRESIPITITSTAHYPIVGIITIRSDQLRFPSGQRFTVTIARSTKVIRIPTRAPTTGSFTALVTLRTPKGGLILTNARLLVVASRTSIVAIILTIGALAVLLAWWVRTWTTGRKKKRRRH